jgi:hypothetical protein
VDWLAFDRALEAGRREILGRFIACLRVDTVSQHPERVRAGAAWLAEAMERRGLEARVLETGATRTNTSGWTTSIRGSAPRPGSSWSLASERGGQSPAMSVGRGQPNRRGGRLPGRLG